MISGANTRAFRPDAQACAARGPRPHRLFPVLRITLALGLVITGLWAIQVFPPLGAVLMPLNVLTAQVTAAMLSTTGLTVTRELVILTHTSGFACEIDFTCTALVPVALLWAAIFPWPVSWRARLLGALAGLLLMVFLNQLRLISLVWLGVYAPQAFDVAHNLLWPAILIAGTVGYGLSWVRAVRR